MSDSAGHQVTDLLVEWRRGDQAALDRLFPLVYDELRRIARVHMSSERPDHTLQTTGLVNEACVRLIGADVEWNDRVHFLAVASTAMRRILVDHARAHRSAKRGAGAAKETLDEAMHTAMTRPWDLLDVDRALDGLAKHDANQARVVELHFFGGMKFAEIATVMERTPDSVAWSMRLAKAWLRRELSSSSDAPTG